MPNLKPLIIAASNVYNVILQQRQASYLHSFASKATNIVSKAGIVKEDSSPVKASTLSTLANKTYFPDENKDNENEQLFGLMAADIKQLAKHKNINDGASFKAIVLILNRCVQLAENLESDSVLAAKNDIDVQMATLQLELAGGDNALMHQVNYFLGAVEKQNREKMQNLQLKYDHSQAEIKERNNEVTLKDETIRKQQEVLVESKKTKQQLFEKISEISESQQQSLALAEKKLQENMGKLHSLQVYITKQIKEKNEEVQLKDQTIQQQQVSLTEAKITNQQLSDKITEISTSLKLAEITHQESITTHQLGQGNLSNQINEKNAEILLKDEKILQQQETLIMADKAKEYLSHEITTLKNSQKTHTEQLEEKHLHERQLLTDKIRQQTGISETLRKSKDGLIHHAKQLKQENTILEDKLTLAQGEIDKLTQGTARLKTNWNEEKEHYVAEITQLQMQLKREKEKEAKSSTQTSSSFHKQHKGSTPSRATTSELRKRTGGTPTLSMSQKN